MKRLTAAIAIAGMLAATVAGATHGGDHAPGPKQVPVRAGEFAALYENVCHLTINRMPGGTKYGSSVLYDGRYLLTAGHNVYQDRSKVNWIEVRCGILEVNEQTPPCSQDPNCQRLKGWQGRDARRYNWLRFPNRFDYGMVRLDEAIAVAQPTRLAAKVPEGNATVRLAGYPGGSIRNGKVLYHAQGNLDRDQDQLDTIWYGIETATGNSGGPVWLVKDDGSYELLAIHIQPSRGRVVNDGFKAEVEHLRKKLDKRAADKGVE